MDKLIIFKCPPRYTNILAQAGFTHISLANNHSLDCGRNGLKETVENLKKFSLIPLGIFDQNNQLLTCHFSSLDQKYHLICIIEGEGLARWEKRPKPLSIADPQVAQWIKSHTGENNHVIVYIHWITENWEVPPSCVIHNVNLLKNWGANIIIGHGSHNIGPIEWDEKSFIIYSLGDTVFDVNENIVNNGILLRLDLFANKIQPYILPYNIYDCQPDPVSGNQKEVLMKRIKFISKGISLIQCSKWVKIIREDN